MKKFFVLLLLLLSSNSYAFFPYEAIVYSPNCKASPAVYGFVFRTDNRNILVKYINTAAQGKLQLVTKNVSSGKEKGSNSWEYTFEYENGSSETYLWLSDSQVKSMYVQKDGKVIVKDGRLSNGIETPVLELCKNNTPVFKEVIAHLNAAEDQMGFETIVVPEVKTEAQIKAEEKKQALEQKRLNAIEEKRLAVEQKKLYQTMQSQCLKYSLIRQTCATAPDYDRCMAIRVGSSYSPTTDSWCLHQ